MIGFGRGQRRDRCLSMTEKEWMAGECKHTSQQDACCHKPHTVGEIVRAYDNERHNVFGCGERMRIVEIVRLQTITKYFFEKVQR